MVSLFKALSMTPRAEVNEEFEASTKKRKWEEPFTEEFFIDKKSTFDIKPRLKTMFPSDKWRQYLSIQVYI